MKASASQNNWDAKVCASKGGNPLPRSLPGDAERRSRAGERYGLTAAQPVTEADDLRLRGSQMVEYLAEFLAPHRVGHDALWAWLGAR